MQPKTPKKKKNHMYMFLWIIVMALVAYIGYDAYMERDFEINICKDNMSGIPVYANGEWACRDPSKYYSITLNGERINSWGEITKDAPKVSVTGLASRTYVDFEIANRSSIFENITVNGINLSSDYISTWNDIDWIVINYSMNDTITSINPHTGEVFVYNETTEKWRNDVLTANYVDILNAADYFSGSTVEQALGQLANEVGGGGIPGTNESSEWHDLVMSKSILSPPVSPTHGDRYIIPYAVSGDWYGAAGEWDYRQKITLESDKVDSAQTNYPITIALDNAMNELFNKAQDDGDDIVFTKSDKTTKLFHELVYYNNTAGSEYLEVHVNVTSVSSSSDTEIYMYYGNPSATTQQIPTKVWDSNYEAIFHMDGATPTTINDSSLNAYVGTLQNGPTEIDGLVHKAHSFDGTNDYADTTISTDLPSGAFTISTFVKDVGTGNRYMITQADHVSYSSAFIMGYTQGGLWMQSRTINGGAIISDGDWHQHVLSFDGTTAHILIDGVQYGGTITPSMQPTVTTVKLFSNGVGGSVVNGIMDELHISTIQRSDDWINLNYENIINMDTFLSFGSEEISSATPTAWTGYTNNITTWNALITNWTFESPNIGWAVIVKNEGLPYWWNGTTWKVLTSSISHKTLNDLEGCDSEGNCWHFDSSAKQIAASREATNAQSGLMPAGKMTLWDNAWHDGDVIEDDLYLSQASSNIILEDSDDNTGYQIDYGSSGSFLDIEKGTVSEGAFTPISGTVALDVDGTTRSISTIVTGSSYSGELISGKANMVTYVLGGTTGRFFGYDGSSYYDVAFGDWNGGDPNIMMKVGGRVGINEGSPQETLHAAGNIRGEGFCIDADCITSWDDVNGSGSSYWTQSGDNIYYDTGNVTVNNSFYTGNITTTGINITDEFRIGDGTPWESGEKNVVTISNNESIEFKLQHGDVTIQSSGMQFRSNGNIKGSYGYVDLTGFRDTRDSNFTPRVYVFYNEDDDSAGFSTIFRNDSKDYLVSDLGEDLVLGYGSEDNFYRIKGGSIAVFGDNSSNFSFIINSENNYNMHLGNPNLGYKSNFYHYGDLFSEGEARFYGNVTVNNSLDIANNYTHFYEVGLEGFYNSPMGGDVLFNTTGFEIQRDETINKVGGGLYDVGPIFGAPSWQATFPGFFVQYDKDIDIAGGLLIIGFNTTTNTSYQEAEYSADMTLGQEAGITQGITGGRIKIYGENGTHSAFRASSLGVEIGDTEAMSALGMWGTLLVNGTIGTNNDITVFNPDGSTFFDAGVSCSTVGIGMDGCYGSKALEVNGTADFYDNVTSDVDFCIDGGNCLSNQQVDTNTHIEGTGYLYNDSTYMYLNETKLNITINALENDTTYTAGDYLYLDSTEFNVNETQLNTTIDARDSQGYWEKAPSGNIYYDTGNVSIGTTTPTGTFHIQTSGDNALIINHNDSDGDPFIEFQQDGALKSRIQHHDTLDDTLFLASYYGDMELCTGSSGSCTPRLFITDEGKIGIGTTTPSAKLDVSGNIVMDDTAYLNIEKRGLNFSSLTGGAYNDFYTYPSFYFNTTDIAPFLPSRFGIFDGAFGIMNSDSDTQSLSFIATTNQGDGELITDVLEMVYNNTAATFEITGADNYSVDGTFQADDYYSGDGTQGYTGSCGSGTTLTVKDGLITGCS
ncbi:MAG: DUF2341 domain-containing protein [Nanoarchaeota archaeon]|nr:DUF2341 domain-containing protein [Nanoarchaeota archaeon]